MLIVVIVVWSLSCVQLLVTPWTSPPFPSKNTVVGCHSLLQGSSWLRDQTCISCIVYFFNTEPPGKLHYVDAAAAKSLQSYLTLCDPIDGSPPGSPVPGILQARMLEWVAISFSNAGKWKVKVKVKSCPTLSDPVDCSLPGSSIHRIFQARVLEWVAISFSRGSSWPRDWTQVSRIAGRRFTV